MKAKWWSVTGLDERSRGVASGAVQTHQRELCSQEQLKASGKQRVQALCSSSQRCTDAFDSFAFVLAS